jgi:hypothetical protein
MTTGASISMDLSFQIRFSSAFLYGRTVAFPCDAHGQVDMDRLSDEGLRDYLFARIMIRRECARPEVVRSHPRVTAKGAGRQDL